MAVDMLARELEVVGELSRYARDRLDDAT